MSQHPPAGRQQNRRPRRPDHTADVLAAAVGGTLSGAARAVIDWLLEYLSTSR